MRRVALVAALAVGGLLGLTGAASADVGDINRLTIDSPLFGDASSVQVTGSIRCQATIAYGLLAVVGQGDPEGARNEGYGETFTVQNSEGGGNAGPNASAEGVGAFGPEFDPPAGISDDSPCSQSISSYDVVVQQNRDSGDFVDGTIDVAVLAGSSAENGDRGPGPFIGDVLTANFIDATFNRRR